MAERSSIEWTNATWNPVRGCALVSPGCTNCYAMRQAHRSSGPGGAYEGLTKMSNGGPVWTGNVRTVPELLDWPLRKKKPLRIFINSMSDLFHESVSDGFIDKVLTVIKRCEVQRRGHVFQLLTKRPKRMQELMTLIYGLGQPMQNLWLGVSVEDQARADERIPLLLQTPAAVRWISAEPLLGPVLLRRHIDVTRDGVVEGQVFVDHLSGLNWVVAGGESGPGARPMHADWARSLRDQCAAAGVPFFFKQWGAWLPPMSDGAIVAGTLYLNASSNPLLVGKKKAGRELDGRTHDEYPA